MDLLDRVFGPDSNPEGTLPILPYQGAPRTGCEHNWSTGTRSGVSYWECLSCGVVRSSEPPVTS